MKDREESRLRVKMIQQGSMILTDLTANNVDQNALSSVVEVLKNELSKLKQRITRQQFMINQIRDSAILFRSVSNKICRPKKRV